MRLDSVVVIGVGALAVILWWRWHNRSDPYWAGLPPELIGACLVYAEQLFRSVGPVSISARVDRVYRNAAGVLALVELKTRTANRAYQSDVIELSAQRLALMAQTGEFVSDQAFVLTERPDGRRTGCHRVRLMPHGDVVELAMRRQDLLIGKAAPELACSPGLCRKCAFVLPCDPPER